jgi:N-acetylmuramoyl-L-alanine amidase
VEKPAAEAPHTAGPAPAAPSANGRGGFSMARQLGLRVGRIVIDAGHGGRDPGAQGPGYTEANLTLDIALRLERLLAKEPGVEVVLTRRTDEYVGLQERTAIANREGADLFVSIHANASRNRSARGVESYLLNFASTPDAAAVAARENASSTLTMSHLNDLVKQIALNSKLDESRDLARHVQTAMVRKLRTSNQQVRDLGVKQAPFIVLVGASMPSVLVEVSFLSHTQEGRLLGTGAYRQRIAEALLDGVRRYLRTLKRAVTDTADGVPMPGGGSLDGLQ